MTKFTILAPLAAALSLAGISASAAEAETTGTIGHYSAGSQIIWLEGDGVYHFRLDQDFPDDLEAGDQVQVTYETRDGIRFITEFTDLS
ncbi:hypothetical protein [Pseudoroseicyclus sp. CXY001]|uniref:hypothetical protein n=1 Tax=Pseudoroseicyclus sp. CXY001 TaxID=3242492 RepID=UPI003571726B